MFHPHPLETWRDDDASPHDMVYCCQTLYLSLSPNPATLPTGVPCVDIVQLLQEGQGAFLLRPKRVAFGGVFVDRVSSSCIGRTTQGLERCAPSTTVCSARGWLECMASAVVGRGAAEGLGRATRPARLLLAAEDSKRCTERLQAGAPCHQPCDAASLCDQTRVGGFGAPVDLRTKARHRSFEPVNVGAPCGGASGVSQRASRRSHWHWHWHWHWHVVRWAWPWPWPWTDGEMRMRASRWLAAGGGPTRGLWPASRPNPGLKGQQRPARARRR
jgi:hypothetical protein